MNRVYDELEPTLPSLTEYQPSHDDDDNSIEPNPTERQSSHGADGNSIGPNLTERQSSHGADGNPIESNAVKQPSITESGEHAIPHSANQPSVAEDDHNMVNATNQPSVAEEDASMSGLAEDLSNLCVTDNGESIFAKRHVFKTFHFLIREQSGSHVWRSCEEADSEEIELIEKSTKEFIKDRKRQYKGILWVVMAVDKAIVYPICTYPQISIMAEWRNDTPSTLMWRGELNKIAGKERVDQDLQRSLPFTESCVHMGRKFVVMSETEFGLDQGKRKGIEKIEKDNQLGTRAQESVQQAAYQPVAAQPAAPLPALAQPAPTQPALVQPATQPTFTQLPAPGQSNEILQSSDFQQMLARMIAQALTQVQTQPASIQPLVQQQPAWLLSAREIH